MVSEGEEEQADQEGHEEDQDDEDDEEKEEDEEDEDQEVVQGRLIKPLAESSIRRIVAEQAVTDLASAVKELVDNALDAGSTTINIRLFGQGMDVVEVSDDGCGVEPESRPLLATRYATSKINKFEDIYEGTGLSMGFRGEALFSLACLSEKLIVATRTAAEPMAQRLEFQRDGTLNQHKLDFWPRKVGTTVAVVKPFHALPARRADLGRRLRAERSKLFRLIEAYAIFCVGVRIHLMDVSNSSSGSREEKALATSSTSTSLKETVSSVLGHKFLAAVSSIEIDLDSVLAKKSNESSARSEPTESTTASSRWHIRGLISKSPQQQQQQQQISSSSSGSTAQRTVNYYCINGRPVELPGMTKILRPIWQGFGGKKRPSCILHFTLPNDAFDINISPDKREVLLTQEQELYDLVRSYVTDFWSSQSNGVFAMQTLDHVPNDTHDKSLKSKRSSRKWPESCENLLEEDDDDQSVTSNQMEDGEERQKHKRRFAFVNDLARAKMQHEHEERRVPNDDDGSPQPALTPVESDQLSDTDKSPHGSSNDRTEQNDTTTPDAESSEGNSKAFNNSRSSCHEMKNDASAGESRTIEESQDSGTAQQNRSCEDEHRAQTAPNHSEIEASSPVAACSTRRKEERLSDMVRRQWLEARFRFNRSNGRDSITAVESFTGKLENVERLLETQEQAVQGVTRNDSPTNEMRTTNRREVGRRVSLVVGKPIPGLGNEETTTWAKKDRDEVQVSSGGPTGNSGVLDANIKQGRNENKDHSTVESLSRFAFCPTNSKKNVGETSKVSNGNGGSSNLDRKRNRDDHNKEEAVAKVIKLESKASASMDSPQRNDELITRSSLSSGVEDVNRMEMDGSTMETQSSPSNNGSDESQREDDDSHRQSEPEQQEEVVWDGFHGTNHISRSYCIERIEMRQRKRNLRNEGRVSPSLKRNRTETVTLGELSLDDKINVGKPTQRGEKSPTETNKGVIALSKCQFREDMQVIGQFNLGFILARTRNNDIWILDQHACDEKYNFERLCRTTVLHEQKLFAPMSLEMSAAEEACILDHMSVFEANGFRFAVDLDAPVRHRLKLTALPHSGAEFGRKAVQFGKDDVSALCAILSEGSSYDGGDGGTGTDGSGKYGNNAVRRYASTTTQMSQVSLQDKTSSTKRVSDSADRILARLPKAIAMFASRACRTSIMIGTALSHKEMDRVVQRLADVEHPWNCPHGRPTMRHVGNAFPMLLDDERRAEANISGPTVTIAPMTQQVLNDDSSGDEEDDRNHEQSSFEMLTNV